ncbi:MAG: RNA polymerase sigma factor [Actinomycetia bacterium]|nr:RNA polymerase sigma factor [Actinomycetes bacterium]
MSSASLAHTFTSLATRRASDEAVLARTLQGDPVAFGEFYRRYYTAIRGYLLARLMDPHAAEDAAQEVFLRVLRAGDTAVHDPRAWLYTLAAHVATDTARRKAARPSESELTDEAPAHLPAIRDSASEILDRETAKSVFTALRRVPPRQRTALVMREVHGLSSADIAEALETTPANSDVLVSRARDAFGRAYAEVCDLPHACRTAVETIYRDLGTGITEPERAALHSHLHDCPRCASEYRRAHSKRYLPSLLPFLVPASTQSGLLARASVWLRSVPEPVLVHIGSFDPSTWTTPAKLGAASVMLAITLAPTVSAVRAATPVPAITPPATPLVAASAAQKLPSGSIPHDATHSVESGHPEDTTGAHSGGDASHTAGSYLEPCETQKLADPTHSENSGAYPDGGETHQGATTSGASHTTDAGHETAPVDQRGEADTHDSGRQTH